MIRRLLAAALAVVAVSCVRHKPVARAPFAPTGPTIWERQIRNAVDAGDGDYGLRTLRKKSADEPENITVRLELAQAYQERGYPDVALEITRLAAARFPESGEVQLALVRALRTMDRRSEALAGLEAFLKAHPQTAPEYFSWLGLLRDESGLWAAGEPAHRKALELAPSLDYLHNNLGYNLLIQKKNEEAGAEFREALKINPGSRIARNNLGLVFANQDAAAQAVASWQSISDPATAHNNMAAIWMEKGNYAGARKELEVALGYNRAHSAALKNLELIGRLDGKPATLAGKTAAETRWARWKTGMRKFFTGPSNDSRTDEVNTVSAR